MSKQYSATLLNHRMNLVQDIMAGSMPTMSQSEKLSAVHHVVHDYANLISSGTMVVAGNHKGCPLTPPINTHVGQAYLLNCRKMYGFFQPPPANTQADDIFAEHFLTRPVQFDLPAWKAWHKAMNKQLFHVTSNRNKKWEGHKENALFLDEFKRAWKLFLSNLGEPYKSEFRMRIEERLHSEFAGLDLF